MTKEGWNWVYDNINLVNKVRLTETSGLYFTELVLHKGTRNDVNKIFIHSDREIAIFFLELVNSLIK